MDYCGSFCVVLCPRVVPKSVWKMQQILLDTNRRLPRLVKTPEETRVPGLNDVRCVLRVKQFLLLV